MQTCIKCDTLSPDTAKTCIKCGANLSEYSSTAVSLKKLQANPRVSHVIVSVPDKACPACNAAQGNYAKDELPRLPVKGCSCAGGCKAFYQPVLNIIFP